MSPPASAVSIGRAGAEQELSAAIPSLAAGAQALSTMNRQLMSTESSAGLEPLEEPLKCFSSQGKLCNTPLSLIYLTGIGVQP